LTVATRRPADRRPPRSPAGSIALIVFATLAAIGALGAVAVVGGYIALSAGLKDPQELENIRPQEESIVYARDGETELARFGELQREIVSFDEIPPILIDATTAVEDKTFWTNSGFDPAAIVAAGVDALRGNARGASTITQQLVRQRLLDEDLVQSRGRTFERKLKEIVQSIRVTQAYPGREGKQDIIAAYLNQNFYGNNSYGVKAAARNYFNKSLEELTLSEVALLAALPQSPSNYDLVRNAVEECNVEVEEGADCPAAERRLIVPADTDIVRRRNTVLGLLAEPDRRPQTEDRWTAPHFVWQVREELTRLVCGEETQTCEALDQGGLRITTTLDVELQRSAERWVALAARVPRFRNSGAAAARLGFDELPDWVRQLKDRELHNGALVALDYETGELVAYVGSADYYSGGAKAQFQPRFDVVADGWRQPGSAFKPLNYVTGFDDGTMTPATMFMDTVTDFGGGYIPNDADRLERGPLRIRKALQFSLNIPAIKAMAVNRVEHVFDRAQDYGVRWREPTTDAGLAFALGVEEIRPIDLVTAYGTIANQGRYTGHTTILEVTDTTGRQVVPRHERPEGEQVLKPEAAALITDILAGNTDRDVNPFWGAFRLDGGDERRPATLKTGTNNDAKDLNAYGYIAPPTEEGREAGEYALAVGAWNGNSDNSLVSTPERPLFSVEVSTHVWQGFLNEATEGWAVNDFARPESLVRVEVDPWTGLLPAEGEPSVAELFIPGTEPTARVGAEGGACGQAILDETYESRFENWLEADLDWIQRARRGPGTRGGLENTPVSYFYNNSFAPYGRSWGPILDGAGCGTPEPSPTCFPVPTPDPSGVVPSFEVPEPEGSGPLPEPCPTAPPTPSPEPTESAPPSEPPTEPPTAPPTEEPPPPTEEPGPPSEPPGPPDATEEPDAVAPTAPPA
jgi:peptidoglycan glycosyltransferase